MNETNGTKKGHKALHVGGVAAAVCGWVVLALFVLFVLLQALSGIIYTGGGGGINTIDELGASDSYVSDSYDSGDTSVATIDEGSASRDKSETKRVYQGYEELETTDFDKAYDGVYGLVESHGGYVSDDSVGYSDYGPSDSDYRHASLTIRIPEASFENAVEAIENIEGVTVAEKHISAADVTEAYTSLEAELETAQSELASLREIQESATTVDERLSVLERVTEQESYVASLQDRIEHYDDVTTYSTLNVDIVERSALDMRSEAAGYGNKLVEALALGWSGGLTFFGGLLLVIARNWLMLVVICVACLVGYRVYRCKHSKAWFAAAVDAEVTSVTDGASEDVHEEPVEHHEDDGSDGKTS